MLINTSTAIVHLSPRPRELDAKNVLIQRDFFKPATNRANRETLAIFSLRKLLLKCDVVYLRRKSTIANNFCCRTIVLVLKCMVMAIVGWHGGNACAGMLTTEMSDSLRAYHRRNDFWLRWRSWRGVSAATGACGGRLFTWTHGYRITPKVGALRKCY